MEIRNNEQHLIKLRKMGFNPELKRRVLPLKDDDEEIIFDKIIIHGIQGKMMEEPIFFFTEKHTQLQQLLDYCIKHHFSLAIKGDPLRIVLRKQE